MGNLVAKPNPFEPLFTKEENLSVRFGVHNVDEAYVTSAHEIRPRVFLGSVAAALDPDEIKQRKITHVVNCLFPTEERFKDRVEYLTLALRDEAKEDILTVLPKAHAFIAHALDSSPNNHVLIHCLAGVSRSATIVTAHLMASEGLTAARALAEVQAVRCCANPNSGFREQLLLFESALAERRRVARQGALKMLTAHIPLRE